MYPIIKITFVDKDTPLALKLKEFLGGGTLEFPKDVKYVNYLIQDLSTLAKVVTLINGKMRTPKIEALHRIIDWFNARSANPHFPFVKLGLDHSNLGDNAWLTGFTVRAVPPHIVWRDGAGSYRSRWKLLLYFPPHIVGREIPAAT